ncbi:MAG: prepilin peptidase [Planctomycetaceae bacterium]|nr:prepilin peptidase [Planctomycetaceae bacterium]
MLDWLDYAGWFVLGTLLGSQINHAIYQWAWHPRCISPWSPAASQAPVRSSWDRLPILGWWGLRRESSIHGAGFWIRPMLLEIGVGISLALLYWWEINRLQAATIETTGLVVRFLSHVTLISLLAIASFIDFDEQTIPDLVTIPGTLIALLLASLAPASLLPVPGPGGSEIPLLLTAPSGWDIRLDEIGGLVCGCACFLAWCLAIVPKVTTLRSGWWRGIRIMVASIIRPRRRTKARLESRSRQPYLVTRLVGCAAVVGSILIGVGWFIGGPGWQSLLTSLLGMAFGGAVIWGVRLVGGYAMKQEAMGFGDVTLMAMIGAFLGWQSSLIVFFLAPFAALLIGLIQLVCVRRTDIAFGPYLALAAVVLVIFWPGVWELRARNFFELGWVVPILVMVCLALMGILLMILQWFKGIMRPSH